ncbi:LLM class F420-dependent oxidoreductase [Rhodococcus erythropolis]|uniref:LLM class F420-dependent oxidoreductase n=1 Tax=Rhodococcus erythropolis TaxID=1833 RepID=UPI001BE926F4|nr:LLM class F420-dependent oxidoreductase [Rhodococcus erythropolis]MBT2269873.1 LLM class F420-dependent oxidoreductase [Rhodococcus erythropolis]
MKFGLSLFTSDRGISPADAARAAEERGFDTVYVPEHTHIPVQRNSNHPATGDATLPDDRYMRTLDPWVALGAAAAVTTRIGLGTSVALPLEHDPIALAKTIATLDHMSGGRVTFGVGYGWNLEELADHGVPPGKRRTALREYLEAMTALWTDDEAAYEGQFVRFGSSWAWPKPVQRPRPPILLGAGGTEKNFTWIVRSADGWITTPIEEAIDSGVEQLGAMWRDAGRSGKPQIVVLADEPDQGKLSHWRDIGITEVVFPIPDANTDDARAYIDQLADQLAAGRR